MRKSADEASLDAADKALALAEPLGLDEVIANALNNRGSVLGHLGRFREGGALMQAAVDIAAAGGFVEAELRARSNQASHSWDQSPRRSTDQQWANLELARRVGNRGMAIWTGAQAIAGSWMCALDWDGALATADELLALARSGPDESRIIGAEAAIRAARGEPTDQHLARLKAIADENGAGEIIASFHYLAASQAHSAGDFRTAVREFRLASEAFKALQSIFLGSALPAVLMLDDADGARRIVATLEGLPDFSGRLSAAIIQVGRAGIAAMDGRTDDAIATFRAVWREQADLGVDFLRAEAILVAAMLLGPITSDIRAAAEEARVLFERLGAQPYLAWLEDAMARPANGGVTGGSEPARSMLGAGEGR